jgi:hypothetical protein
MSKLERSFTCSNVRNLTFMGPCGIVIIFQYISNKMKRYTVYFIWKLLYMFRVVPPPIIRSANSCIYSNSLTDKINFVTLHLVAYTL